MFKFLLFYAVANACMPTDNSRNPIVSSTPQGDTTTAIATTTEACCSFPFLGAGPTVVVEGCDYYVFTCYIRGGFDITVGLFYNMTLLSNGTIVADQDLLVKTNETKVNFTLSCNTTTLLWNLESYEGITNIENVNCGYQKENSTYTSEW